MPKAIQSQGTVISYSDGGSPTSFTALGNVTGISGLGGGSANINDVTNLDSTFKEKLLGLPDEGQITVNINFDPDNAGHIYLRNARKNRTRLEFRITMTDTTPAVAAFFGYVMQSRVDYAVGRQVTGQVVIEIDGEVSWN